MLKAMDRKLEYLTVVNQDKWSFNPVILDNGMKTSLFSKIYPLHLGSGEICVK
ncbi:Uncharacterised protein [Legionella steigerwaltii]|uniref:Uncharacterized protein n=1 Tax=Legionella steigerwaltii TaxID=460 RepID=A0A378LE27_9GAMM|nr:hypothetical protein Lstg_1249 [Legionella steigerwaltii]STY24128.1 Uncharacterised protein [Legionella steigerwaltii]